ncbi:glycosyltransferase [Dehalococcoides mccartyi]|uniref:Glycosyltransferase n=1 Tax=Dehalococcoides mccartyi TaxID=61435 RepID=A0AB38ZBV5_9CHLR|nr:glycosyltransferase [Dehalococcoides mccartyi]WRO08057.1 glycosyltransferase [Dehalococcoides mccartyi]
MENIMSLSVVICTRNSASTIKDCLDSLMPAYRSSLIREIIIVDAQSTDATCRIAGDYPVRIYFEPGKGVYFGYQYALGIASGEYVLFLDSDAYLDNTSLTSVLNTFTDPEVGLVGVYSFSPDKSRLGRCAGQWWDYHRMRLLAHSSSSLFGRLYHRVVGFGAVYTSGPCFIASRQCLEATGGFAPELYLYYLHPKLAYPGDIMLSKRAVNAGYKAVWANCGRVGHYPPANALELWRQRVNWGRGDAAYLKICRTGFTKRATCVLSRLGSPFMALYLAFRYRNPVHLWYLPLAQLAWLGGYFNFRLKR